MMAGKKALPTLLPNGVPPPQSGQAPPPPHNGPKPVLRVNRACNACRKQKMRCEGPDNPPCARCRANATECIFEKVPKSDPDSNERLQKLETQFVTMQATLSEILAELRNPSRHLVDPINSALLTSTPTSATLLHELPNNSRSQLTQPPTPEPTRPPGPYPSQIRQQRQLPSLHSVLPRHYHSRSPPASTKAFTHRPSSVLNHLYPPSHLHPSHRRLPAPSSPYRPTLLSGITSAANSDDEGDIPSSALLAPIGVLNDLASVAAQSNSSRQGVKRKRGEGSSPEGKSHFGKYTSVGLSPHGTQSTPRMTASEASPAVDDDARLGTQDTGPEELEGHSISQAKSEAVEDERSPEREQDAIEKGIVSEEEAMELHQIYFTGCYRVLAVFNKSIDTLASIRARSPFLLNCILMTASKARDGGGPPSQTQMALVRECSCMAKEYLFGPVKSVEIVQGLLLIAGWSHSTGPIGWLAAGHAIRYAVELGLHKALPRLARRQNVPSTDRTSDTERALIVAARTWCGLYVFEYQISFGTGRPAMMKGDKSLIRARDILLKHPLAIPTDVRLVSTCELMTLQSKIHDRLGPLDEPVNENQVIETLSQSIVELDAWLAEWTIIMRELGLSSRDMEFFHSSARIQLLYAHLFHHCIALRNLHTIADAKALRPEMKAVALRAIEYAQSAIRVCLDNAEYRFGLRYAIAYSHTCATFAGAFLLRLTRLFPQDLDVHAMIVMVDQLAHLLEEVPAGRFARSLFQMIKVSQARLQAKKETTPPSDTRTEALPIVDFSSSAVIQPLGGTEYTNDFGNLMSSNLGLYEHGVPNDIAHGLLSVDGDWPEWIQNSIYGDLPVSGDHAFVGTGQGDYNIYPPYSYLSTNVAESQTTLLRDNPVVQEVYLTSLMETVLPHVSQSLLEKAYKNLTTTRTIRFNRKKKTPRWCFLSQDPSQSNIAEGKTFKFLEEIAGSTTKNLNVVASLDIRLLVTGEATPPSNRRNTSRPDGHLHIAKAGKQVGWSDIIMPMEFKKSRNDDSTVDGFGKVIWSMHHIMRNDPCRRYVYGLTWEDTKARLWFNNRSDIVASEEFDINTDWKQLVRILLSIQVANSGQLGFDFSMTAAPNNNGESEPSYDITVHNDKAKTACVYRTLRVISDLGTDSLTGRGTRVWEVRKLVNGLPCGPSYALKDVWVYADRTAEHQLLNTIRTTHTEYAQHLLTPIDHGFVPHDSAATSIPDSTHEPLGCKRQFEPTKILLRTRKRLGVAYMGTSTGSKTHLASTSRDSIGLPDPIPPSTTEGHCNPICLSDHTRYHYRIVFQEIGTPVQELRVFSKVFTAIQGGWEGLHAIHLSGKVHRDVSSGNVMLVPAMGTLAERGVVLDLEYAKDIHDTSTPHDVRTGTRAFMATEDVSASIDLDELIEQSTLWSSNLPMRAPPFRHNPLHDMESFWWLCVWMMFYLVPTGTTDRDRLADFHSIFHDERTKRNSLSIPVFREFTLHLSTELTSLLVTWLDLMNQIYNAAYKLMDLKNTSQINDKMIEKSYQVGKRILEDLRQVSAKTESLPMITLQEHLEVKDPDRARARATSGARLNSAQGTARGDFRRAAPRLVMDCVLMPPRKRRHESIVTPPSQKRRYESIVQSADDNGTHHLRSFK
ncbi:Fungal specific transcription factor domain [Rhizoctonia solani]|uniref:Fungal specific transcription factor domain n=1 Tax=Rhizoctonia solani TaxID=456999 RepID=A0A8H8P4D6_9AGAM|nr:Fungal specific transcription factor domain [Rhizoctonia solani]QRW24935.1 Fungal specific transcription factor domain [Rhizoctonia solani]